MPKLKSHSGAKKRFRRSARGKWKHKQAGLRHLLIGMSAKTGRQLRRARVAGKVQGRILDRLLPSR
ncbi:MAG: 50S ribosomal protein L35 [Elusimicrobia bacterium RIFCSPLOWO2_12_FULL_59_9]|nr:50S ribosomal protein L35 [Elusimicrobiota bacterium]OGS01442.1 MAG: 50S ribosomal protein L35 [Elusimicrobia bacterium RIFCSPLOWO2_12_FULL_59_9]